MKEFTDSNFQKEVLEAEGLVVADFWAPWCRPCLALTPILENVNAAFDDATIGKVNVDENPGLATDYNIGAVPSILFFKNGSVVTKLVGMQNEGTLRETIEGLLND